MEMRRSGVGYVHEGWDCVDRPRCGLRAYTGKYHHSMSCASFLLALNPPISMD